MTAKMETTFYDDALNASFLQSESGAYGYSNPKVLKQSMTLNLADPVGSLKPHLRAKNSDLLTSPDVGLLKLASPELERLIIQSSNGHITTTPTPTQFLCPKNVTDEQEGFAEGFVRALAELHSQNTLPSVTSAAPPVSGAGMVAPAVASAAGGGGGGGFSASLHSEPPVYANLSKTSARARWAAGGALLRRGRPGVPRAAPAAAAAAAAPPAAADPRAAPAAAGPEGGAADGARDARGDAAPVPHRHGVPGADQGGEKAHEEPHRCLQVPEKEAGEDRPAGGKSENLESAELGAGVHGQHAQGTDLRT
uniref:Jun proto-onco, AP-1 transcription factor subunit n=1 Tax=Equus asinus TaxID=9793 RepID=A0A9L0IQ40_EQUAS